MLVLQHNCRRAYAITIAALELGLQLGVGLACLQEPYIDRDFTHGGYLLYWPEKGERREKRVVIAVRRDIPNQLAIEARTDLLDHPYLMVLDIWELSRAQERARRTRIVNCYDNWLGAGHCWQGEDWRRRRAIEDANWDQVIEGRCLLLGDFNAHSPLWNPQARVRNNAGPLEGMIDRFDLYVNNDPETPTRPKSTPGVSIIDLSPTTPELGPLPMWYVAHNHPTGSDHETIVMEWDSLQRTPMGTSQEITGWQIEALQTDKEALKRAMHAWKDLTAANPPLLDTCTEEDITGKPHGFRKP